MAFRFASAFVGQLTTRVNSELFARAEQISPAIRLNAEVAAGKAFEPPSPLKLVDVEAALYKKVNQSGRGEAELDHLMRRILHSYRCTRVGCQRFLHTPASL